jgi:hypothetical protein
MLHSLRQEERKERVHSENGLMVSEGDDCDGCDDTLDTMSGICFIVTIVTTVTERML